MPHCKRCEKDTKVTKSGKVKGVQRYRCAVCGYHFIEGDKREKFGSEVKAMAVLLYVQCKASYGMIAKLLNTSRFNVYQWVKKAAKQLPDIPMPLTVRHIEFDEMWHFVGSKKKEILDLESLRS